MAGGYVVTWSALNIDNAYLGNGLAPGGPYDDSEPPCGGSLYPEQSEDCGAYTIRFYDRAGVIKDIDSSNMRCSSLLTGSKFVVDGSGAKTATLSFSHPRFLNIGIRDLVSIFLDNRGVPVWNGYVHKVPSPCDTSDGYTIQAVGLSAQLKWGSIQIVYAGISVYTAVKDIAERYITELTDIEVVDYLISPEATYPISNMAFESATIDQAITQLAAVAGNFRYGVDEYGRFYFQPPIDEQEVQDWHICKDFDDISSSIDSSRLANQLWVKHGQAAGGGSAILAEPLNDEVSQAEYGVQPRAISAPSSLEPVDAYRYASVQLSKLAYPIHRATIKGMTYRGVAPSMSALGRCHGKDGCVVELPQKQASYTFRDGYLDMDLQLGELESDLVELVRELDAIVARRELEDRTNA